ncbi:hypothetical protein BDV12DRAFT_41942 [Aspergillus spectabilis]
MSCHDTTFEETSGLPVAGHSSIQDLTGRCCFLFEQLLSFVEPKSEDFNLIETESGRLNIWASNVGALAYETASLDHRLRYSHDIKSLVAKLLGVLERNLQQATVVIYRTKNISAANETVNPNEEDLSQLFAETLQAVSESLDRLQRLAVIIRKSSAQSRNVRTRAFAEEEDEENFEQFAWLMVKHRFKEASESLCEQLANSIAMRRRAFVYKAKHQKKLAFRATTTNVRQSVIAYGSRSTEYQHEPSSPMPPLSSQVPLNDAPERRTINPAPSRTNASTLDTTLFRHLLRDYKPPSSLVSKVTSFQDMKLDYPPPPIVREGQKGCICPYCCEILPAVKVNNDRWWKNHVDADLEPYVCISEKCKITPVQFVKLDEWKRHMSQHGPSEYAWNVHLLAWVCPVCEAPEPFRWKDQFMRHLACNHSKRFTQTQLSTLVRSSTLSVPRGGFVCPLCNAVPQEIEIIVPEDRKRYPDLLLKHIAAHLKSLLLLSLPYRDDVNDDMSAVSHDPSLGGAAGNELKENTTADSDLAQLSLTFDDDELYDRPIAPMSSEGDETEFSNMEFPANDEEVRFSWNFIPVQSYDWKEDTVIRRFVAALREREAKSSRTLSLWKTAYEHLSNEERNTLLANLHTKSDNEYCSRIVGVITEIIQSTEEQYENFEKRVDGRLRECSQRIINAALSFQDVISAVAASDHNHYAASAWAIVSLGLTIAQKRYDLRSALFESSEYLADLLAQCSYIEHKFYIKGNVEKNHDLDNAMIRLYKAILHYTAQIQIAQDPSSGGKPLNCVTTITEYPLTELKASVEKERRHTFQRIGLVEYLSHEDEAKEMLRRIDDLTESMNRLIAKFDISSLYVEKGAFYDSYVNQHEDFCFPGTRTELLSQILEWAKSPNEKCVFWLNGMAGTGKSTIARTVAQLFKDKGQLGATFFCKRGEANRGNARYLVSTITRQLVTRYRQLVPVVLAALENDPDISFKRLDEQLDKLLLQPLLKLRTNRPTTIVIVIDAMDECDREDDIQAIIQYLLDLQDHEFVCLRIFLTSRPELPVRLGFKRNNNHKDVHLHELSVRVIEDDIRLFLEYKLSGIQKERSLPPDWPGKGCIETLVEMATPLFSFAATICRFVGDKNFLPDERLAAILRDGALSSTSDLERTYLAVLNQLLISKSRSDSEQLLKEFQDTVGVIILLATPLSVISLSQLTGVPVVIISNRLNRFHSVLNIPSELHEPVRILHLSFRDFLVSTTSTYHVNKAETHHKIALHCFRVMADRLKHNNCGLPSYGTQTVDISRQTVDHHLSADLQYSCQYWIYHVQQSEGHILELQVFTFLENHFLHWLEALSLMGAISNAVGMIDMLQVAFSGADRITSFLHDARRFILKNTYIAQLAPLQLYSSGLVFSPMQSTIRKLFSYSRPKHIRTLPQVEDYWSPALQTLEGHSDSVQSVAFSHDSQMVASGSGDNTINSGMQRPALSGRRSRAIRIWFGQWLPLCVLENIMITMNTFHITSNFKCLFQTTG